MAVRVCEHAERFAGIPNERVHFVRIAKHRLEMRARVVKLLGDTEFPAAGRVGIVRGWFYTVRGETLQKVSSELVFGVVGSNFDIGREDCTQKIRKTKIDGRRVVQSPDRHRQQIFGDGDTFLYNPVAIEVA